MSHRVLVVDDDAAVRKVASLVLENAGFDTHAVSSGDDALAETAEGDLEPDCILLDIRMPGLSGVETLERLKERMPAVPVVMMTANTELETAIATMRDGAFDYLVKPVRKVRLEETVRKAIRYRELTLENERLVRENLEYQHSLEEKVAERTSELEAVNERLRQTNLDTVEMLAETIDAKDPYTRGHCNRVRTLTLETARAAGLDPSELQMLEYAALLHDVGKIGVPESLLNKTGPLSDDELQQFRRHTTIGENILRTVAFFAPCLPVVRSHHEWFDGSGYPDGLSGGEIPRRARIVSVADAYDAMTSNRPYRAALSTDEALARLDAGSGTQFDPEVLRVFVDTQVYRVLPG